MKDFVMDKEVKSLIEAARLGDESAFEALVSIYTPLLESVCQSLELSLDEAYSEACMSLFSAIKSYDLTQDEVTFGLYAKICLRNRLLDYISRERAREIGSGDDDSIVDDTFDAGEELLRLEERRIFHESARRILSDYEYIVFQKWLLLDKTAAIAAELGTSAKSIDNAKARILKKLRQGLSR